MPNQKIAETFVDNGKDGSHTNTLRVLWGAKGDAPDAPDGWVNAGYAHIQITRETEHTGDGLYVELNAADMDHLIRALRKIRRKTFDQDVRPKRGPMEDLRRQGVWVAGG